MTKETRFKDLRLRYLELMDTELHADTPVLIEAWFTCLEALYADIETAEFNIKEVTHP